MVNQKMKSLGKQSSAIRELFEYGKTRKSVSDIFGSETPIIAVADDSGHISSGNTKTDKSLIQPLEDKP